jgi:hypothetical protein
MILSIRSPSLLVWARVLFFSVLTISSCPLIRKKGGPLLETHLAANEGKYERISGAVHLPYGGSLLC